MRKLVYALLLPGVIVACTGLSLAQTRIDSTELRERQRQRQRAIENPANNPFKIEPYDPLKPGKLATPSVVRATVELQIVGVADGDTLIISNTAGQQVLLRLQGIDAPEPGQSFANEATAQLTKIASGKAVSVEFEPRGKPDTEGRIIAKVYLDGEDLALSQIKAGFAWYCKDYKKLLSESDRYTYAEAEKEARADGRGLWQERSPRAPWSFRKK